MKEIDLMLFDLDGTLIDSSLDIIAAANYTRKALGLPAMEGEAVISFVGDGSYKLVERLIGVELRHRFDEALALFFKFYDEHLLDKTILYPGVMDVLNFFSGKKKVIITNKRYHFTRKITDTLEISDCFECIVGMDSTPFIKPDARILSPFLEKFHVDPFRTVVVGDGINDIKLAANAGVNSCAMMYGFTDKNMLLSLKPDFICDNILELKEIFC